MCLNIADFLNFFKNDFISHFIISEPCRICSIWSFTSSFPVSSIKIDFRHQQEKDNTKWAPVRKGEIYLSPEETLQNCYIIWTFFSLLFALEKGKILSLGQLKNKYKSQGKIVRKIKPALCPMLKINVMESLSITMNNWFYFCLHVGFELELVTNNSSILFHWKPKIQQGIMAILEVELK